MYFSCSRNHGTNDRRYLSLDEGMRDAFVRRVHTQDWAVWKNEVVWISAYFTFGVWLSIGMIFVRF